MKEKNEVVVPLLVIAFLITVLVVLSLVIRWNERPRVGVIKNIERSNKGTYGQKVTIFEVHSGEKVTYIGVRGYENPLKDNLQIKYWPAEGHYIAAIETYPQSMTDDGTIYPTVVTVLYQNIKKYQILS